MGPLQEGDVTRQQSDLKAGSETIGNRSAEPAQSRPQELLQVRVCYTAETGRVKNIWAQPGRQNVQTYSHTYVNLLGCKATEYLRESLFI